MRQKLSFTLIELLVTIAIIMVIGAIVLMNVSEARKSSRDAKRISDLDEIRGALETYKDKKGTYPLTKDENTYVLSSGGCEPTPDCTTSTAEITSWSNLEDALTT